MSLDTFYMQIICFGVLLLAANFGGKLSRHLRIGEVVGQVIGGLLIGPVLLFFVEESSKELHSEDSAIPWCRTERSAFPLFRFFLLEGGGGDCRPRLLLCMTEPI